MHYFYLQVYNWGACKRKFTIGHYKVVGLIEILITKYQSASEQDDLHNEAGSVVSKQG